MRLFGPLGSLASGVLVAMAFAPFNLWPLAPLGLALFTVLIRWGADRTERPWRRSLWWGQLMGIGLFGVLVGWVYVLGWYVAVALVLLMSCWGALAGFATAAVRRLPAWPLWTALVWSLVEFGSARIPFGGFGWMRLGFTTPDMPLSGLLPWVGVPGTSLAVALVGTLLAWGMERMAPVSGVRARLGRSLLPGALVIALVVVGGVAGLRGPQPAQAGTTHAVGMVQGDVDGTAGSEAMGYARSVTNNHVSETIMLMAKARTGQTPMPQFLLWPENATDIDPTRDAATEALVNQAEAISGVPIMVGAVMAGPGKGERQTSALWWRDGQVQARYDKRNLVPFGEYIPMRSTLLPMLPILEQVGAQSVPGTAPGVMTVQAPGVQGDEAFAVGNVVCFELAWDGTVYEAATQPAMPPQVGLLLVQSNNATYTGTGQPRQQFQMTRVRAMELRRDIVVATTSSFSGHIDPLGRVLDRTEESTSASTTYVVPSRAGTPPSVTVGPWVDRLGALAAAVAIITGLVGARRRTLRARATVEDTPQQQGAS